MPTLAATANESDTPSKEASNERSASYQVGWDENEIANPHNWSKIYRAWITLQLAMLAMAASLGSSIIAPAESVIEDYFEISHEVAVLTISLYM
jgi:hypothetical protein